MLYLIMSKGRSQSCAMFWTQSKYGYTTNVDEAGRFSEEESAAIVRSSPEKDLRIPESALGSAIRTSRVVYTDYLENLENLRKFDELSSASNSVKD